MAIRRIDSDAGSSSDDYPLSSAEVMAMRETLEELYLQRAFAGGTSCRPNLASTDVQPYRFCAPFPTSYPLGMIYVDPADSEADVVCEIRGTPDWTIDEASCPSGTRLRLALTLMEPDGRYDYPEAADWLTVLDTDGPNLQVTAPLRSRRGWLCLLLWVHSEVAAAVDNEDFDPVLAQTGYRLALAAAGPLVTQPSEYAVQVHRWDASKGVYDPVGHKSKVGYFEVATFVIYPAPPLPVGDLAGGVVVPSRVYFYPMGVLVFESAAWRLDYQGTSPMPGELAYATHQPVAERATAGLVSEIMRLGASRVPLYWADTGQTQLNVVGRYRHQTTRDATASTDPVDALYMPIYPGFRSVGTDKEDVEVEVIALLLHTLRSGGYLTTNGVRFAAPGLYEYEVTLSVDELVAGAWVHSHDETGIGVFEPYSESATSDPLNYPEFSHQIWGHEYLVAASSWSTRGMLMDPRAWGSRKAPDHWHISAVLARITVASDSNHRVRLRLHPNPTHAVGTRDFSSVLVTSAARMVPWRWRR